MNSVVLVKLINGETIIGELISRGSYTSIKNPVIVVMIPNKLDHSSPSFGFAPWNSMSSDEVFDINNSAIISVMNPIKEFENQYKQMFSKVIMPNSGLILPGN